MSNEQQIAPVPIAGQQPKSAMIAFGEQGIAPRTMEEAFIFARAILNSGLAPKDCKSVESVLIRVQFGAEIGLSPMMALQSIADINGRPGLFGDVGRALLRSKGFDIEERDIEEIKQTGIAKCTVSHPRQKTVTRTFSIDDAKKAGLWGKAGPWTQYPYRMLMFRAFWPAARDGGGDVLRGIGGVEELRDVPREERNVSPQPLAHALESIDLPKQESPAEPPQPEQKAAPAEELFMGDEQTREDLAASRSRE